MDFPILRNHAYAHNKNPPSYHKNYKAPEEKHICDVFSLLKCNFGVEMGTYFQ